MGRDRINALKGAKHLRLLIDLNHLRSDGRGDLAGRIMRRPAPYMYALRKAARDVALAMDPAFNKTLKQRDILIGFEGRSVERHGHHNAWSVVAWSNVKHLSLFPNLGSGLLTLGSSFFTRLFQCDHDISPRLVFPPKLAFC